jgi:hypothetical protein
LTEVVAWIDGVTAALVAVTDIRYVPIGVPLLPPPGAVSAYKQT